MKYLRVVITNQEIPNCTLCWSILRQGWEVVVGGLFQPMSWIILFMTKILPLIKYSSSWSRNVIGNRQLCLNLCSTS